MHAADRLGMEAICITGHSLQFQKPNRGGVFSVDVMSNTLLCLPVSNRSNFLSCAEDKVSETVYMTDQPMDLQQLAAAVRASDVDTSKTAIEDAADTPDIRRIITRLPQSSLAGVAPNFASSITILRHILTEIYSANTVLYLQSASITENIICIHCG